MLQVMVSNPLLNICISSWFIAQVIKTVLDWVSHKSLNPERLTGSGGMPSSHSALVTSLTIGMARVEGFSSPLFALTMAFAAVVMYDAMGVRRAAGEQAKVLNRMLFDVSSFFDSIRRNGFPQLAFDDGEDEDGGEDENERQQYPLKEYLGHTPLEVLAGALLGILVAMIYPL